MASISKAAKAPPSVLDVIIIGGGLSGLIVAREIHQWQGEDALQWKLLEAQTTLGGRLKNDDEGRDIDLGGAWIWPHAQPRMKKLVGELGVKLFPQPDDDSSGSMRMVGGAVQLIHRLAATVPSTNIVTNSPVKSCILQPAKKSKDDPLVVVHTTNDEVFLARKVVLAAPPKMILKHIEFTPRLPRQKVVTMESCPTWMSAVTKVCLLYPNRFWSPEDSNCGMQGSSVFQMYDASTRDGRVKALTFFTLVPPSDTVAMTNDKVLADQVADQISHFWARTGRPQLAQQVKAFTEHYVQRWPLEPFISDDPHSQLIEHPMPYLKLCQSEWNGTLHFAGSEADQLSPGVMEGAVGAALRVAGELQQWWFSQTGK